MSHGGKRSRRCRRHQQGTAAAGEADPTYGSSSTPTTTGGGGPLARQRYAFSSSSARQVLSRLVSSCFALPVRFLLGIFFRRKHDEGQKKKRRKNKKHHKGQGRKEDDRISDLPDDLPHNGQGRKEEDQIIDLLDDLLHHKGQGRKEEDRISDLPDDLLHHVLSSLDMKYVVRTGALSTRWRHVWASSPHLNCFHDGESYARLIDTALSLRDPSSDLTSFVLHWRGGRVCGSKDRPHPTAAWIRYVAWHNVRVLKLYFFAGFVEEDGGVPPCIFTCQSLEVLHLVKNYEMPRMFKVGLELPVSASLPKLRQLYVCHFKFAGDSLGRLVSCCPTLEELHLENSRFDSIYTLDISNPHLRKLTLTSICVRVVRMRVSCPSLQQLYCTDIYGLKLSLENLSSLRHASYEARYHFDGGIVIGTLEGLRNAHTLSLVLLPDHVKAKNTLFTNPPTLHNLKKLFLFMILDKHTLRIMITLLGKSPNLENLTIRLTSQIVAAEEFQKFGGLLVDCLQHLKTIEIESSRGKEPELVQFLMMNAKALQRMVVNGHKVSLNSIPERMVVNGHKVSLNSIRERLVIGKLSLLRFYDWLKIQV